MADKAVRRVVETARDACIEGELPHEDEEGHDRKAVRFKGVEDVLGEQVVGRFRRDDIGKPDKTDNKHCYGELEAHEEKEQQGAESKKSDRYLIHCSLPGAS
jgi:hypothetical protein